MAHVFLKMTKVKAVVQTAARDQGLGDDVALILKRSEGNSFMHPRHYLVCLLFVGFLGGCGKDPVVADLEAFNARGEAVFGKNAVDMQLLSQHMQSAKTKEEVIAALEEALQEVEGKTKALADFKPATPEVTKVTDEINGGFASIVKGLKDAEEAVRQEDRGALAKLGPAMIQAQQQLQQGVRDFAQLSKEKGVSYKH